MNAITIQNLKKNFGRITALGDLNLTVPKGSVYGFIGPNRAGKSTAIRILLGLLKKNTGTVELGGDPWRDGVALHKRLAYAPSDVQLWDQMTGGEVIDFLGQLRSGYSQERRAGLIRRFDLDPAKKCRTTTSSGGFKKLILI